MTIRGKSSIRAARRGLLNALSILLVVSLAAVAPSSPAVGATAGISGPVATSASTLTGGAEPQVIAQATEPATNCVTGSSRPYIGTTTPQLRAQVSDPEGSPMTVSVEWWAVGGGSALGSGDAPSVASGDTAVVTTSALTPGGDYMWRARAFDGTQHGQWSGWCEFTVDITAPNAMPTVGSTEYPERSSRPTGYISSVRTQSFIRVDENVLVLSGDDDVEQISLPFAFPFYGQNYSTAWVDTNGSLYFTDPGGYHRWCGSVPTSAAPNGGVYAFCADLDIDSQASIRTATLGTAPSRQFIVEWRNAKQYGLSEDRVSFEIILHEETGDIVTNYADIDLGGLGFDQGENNTVGVENADGSAGELYSHREWVIRNDVAVVFKPAVVVPVSYAKTTEAMPYEAASTPLGLYGDDQVNYLDLPFVFPYYGRGRTRIWVDTNGAIYLTDPGPSHFTCEAIPNIDPPNGGIMAFCDDLIVGEETIRTALVGTAPYRTFVIEWNDVCRYGAERWADVPNCLNIQIRLGEDGTITFNYDDIDPTLPEERGSSATVGIESQSGTTGLQHGHFEAVLASNTAVKFTPQYGEPTSTGGAGVAGTFAFGNGGVSDVTSYRYGLDVTPPTTLADGNNVTLAPQTDGPHILYVQSQDRAGNLSPIAEYRFYAGPGGLTSPSPSDVTASTVELAAEGHPASTAVTYQWRRADTDAWSNIPLSHVTRVVGGGPVDAWPIVTSGSGQYPRLVWDVASTLAAADPHSIGRDGPLQVRAVFSGLTAGEAKPVKITFDRNRATAASEEVGPGSVNLVTGNFTLGATDVSAGGLGLIRAYNTRRSDELDAMFGPGWVSSVVAGGSPYTSVKVFGSLLQVGLPDGKTIGFTATGSGTTFEPPPEAEGLMIVYSSSEDRYTLSDEAGNTVVFGRSAGDPAGEYRPFTVSAAGSGEIATVSWEKVVLDGVEVTRPTRVLGPVPAGVSCTTMARGCRSLTFTYASGRVQSVDYTAWDPATSAMLTRTVAAYAYDGNGRLQAAWDPRLNWIDGGVQNLKVQYGYSSDGVLNSLTPPGQQPWQLHYTTVAAGDPGKGRLFKAVRATATTTVVYGVPVAGAGAPYDLSVQQTGRWGQVIPPVQATALFPPTQIPDGSSYERATVSYLDASGRLANTVQPGGYISTAWYDHQGNVERELTAGNRKRALDFSATDTPHQELVRALSLSTYNPYLGNELMFTLEPEHEMQLTNGTVVRGRKHSSYTYQNGLVVSTIVQARWWDNAGVAHDSDARVTATEYDLDTNLPIKSIVDPGGLALTTRTAHDSKGRVIRMTTPAGGTSDNTPSTRETVYYSAEANGSDPGCGNRPEWDGLVCLTRPGGQPTSGLELPVTTATYDYYGQAVSVIESNSSGALRTTNTTYDAAGRARTIAVSAPGLGEPLQVRRNVYEQATGQLIKTQTLDASENVTAEIVRGYDDFGRSTSYTDADGNISTVTYDAVGRPSVANDGKATRTFGYDGGGERRGLLTSVVDSEVGLFTGSYDADGNLAGQMWPNGVQVDVSNDAAGSTTSVTYAKGITTLFHETVLSSGHGQPLRRVSTLSSQGYGYDAAARLTRVAETLGGSCNTRIHAFDAATNRTSLTNYGPGPSGDCQTNTQTGVAIWTFDAADRAATSGYAYDGLGRTLTMPGSDTAIAGGGQATMTYYINDMVRSIGQGSRSATYTLDVVPNRVRSWTDDQDGTAVMKVNHFTADGDSPAWTDEGSGTWTRQIASVGGVVAAVHTATAGEQYVVVNLGGDVVAAISQSGSAITSAGEYTESGQPHDSGSTGTKRYGWLGASQRSADNPGGIVLMGARLYAPGSGRFLSTDPVYRGNSNAYEYCNGDGVGCSDTSGLLSGVDCRYSYSSGYFYYRRYTSSPYRTGVHDYRGLTRNARCVVSHYRTVQLFGYGGLALASLAAGIMFAICSGIGTPVAGGICAGAGFFITGFFAIAGVTEYTGRCPQAKGINFWGRLYIRWQTHRETWVWWLGGGTTTWYARYAYGTVSSFACNR